MTRPPSLTLRDANLSDAAALCRVFELSWPMSAAGAPEMERGDFLRRHYERFWAKVLQDADHRTRVATVDAAVVGFSVVRPAPVPSWWELDRVFVHPDFQGHGMGRALSTDVYEWAEQVGALGLELWVLEQNERARGLYERDAWVVAGERKTVGSLTWDRMELRLSPVS